MKPVYRQLRPRSVWLVAGLLSALAGGCGGGTRGSSGSPGVLLQPRRYELSDFLASTATTVDSKKGAQLLASRGAGWISAPSPSWRAHGRFLGWSLDGAGFFLVRTQESSPQEELTLVSVRGSLPQTLYVAQAGFRIAAVSARGDRFALVRELDPDTTEVLLHDRTRAETRLLMPVDRNARFLPQAFSRDGGHLLLFSDGGADTMQLEILDLATGDRQFRPRAGCDARQLDPAADGAIYALQWTCAGAVEAGLFEAVTGAELGTLPLPMGTRVARALPAAESGGALYEIASGRFPRDLMFAERADPDAVARPLTFGLAPAIAAEDLVEPTLVHIRRGEAPDLPAELWWPRRALPRPPALLWIEDDARPPAWREFHPFLQFLANRGIAVLRLRPRGALGFGRRFRHAADGRLADAGLEDLDAARTELERRGVDAQRIAVLGEGSWAGALAATAMVERAGRFVAAIDLGGDPDPLRQLDLVPTLAEPARAWWIARLGDPATESAQRDRSRMRFPTREVGRPLFVAVDPQARAWSQEATAARLAFDAANRIDLAPGTEAYDGLTPSEVAALWTFLTIPLATAP